MGDFYVNVSVKGARQPELLEMLKGADLKAVVGPDADGWCCFSDEALESQDQKIIDSYLEEISGKFEGVALSALCHDEDFLSLDLYRDGKPIAEYNSCPGYYAENPTEGDLKPRLANPEAFCNLASGISVADVTELLVPRDDPYISALDAHYELIKLLKLPEYGTSFGFNNAVRRNEYREEDGFLRTWKEDTHQ